MAKPKGSRPPPQFEDKAPDASGAFQVLQTPLELEETTRREKDLVKKVAEIVLSIVHEESFSGPLPHPRHLAEYDAILPGSADRIIGMAEKEQSHRHRWETRSLNFDFTYSVVGIFLGFLIACALLYLAFMSSQNNHPIAAGLFLGAGAIGMVASFIKGRSWLKSRKPADTAPLQTE